MRWKTGFCVIGIVTMFATLAPAEQGSTAYYASPSKHWWEWDKSTASMAKGSTGVSSSVNTPLFEASQSLKLTPINPSPAPTFKQRWDKFWGVPSKSQAKKNAKAKAKAAKAKANSEIVAKSAINQPQKTGDPFWDSFWYGFFHPLAPKAKTTTATP